MTLHCLCYQGRHCLCKKWGHFMEVAGANKSVTASHSNNMFHYTSSCEAQKKRETPLGMTEGGAKQQYWGLYER